MARTIRTESAAHAALSARVQSRAMVSNDWRAILAKRDLKRTARHYRQARRGSHVPGFYLVSLALVLMACAMFFYLALQASEPARMALSSKACSAPIQACASASECRAMLAPCREALQQSAAR